MNVIDPNTLAAYNSLALALLAGDLGVAETTYVPPQGVRVVHEPGASPQQREAAATLVQGWDWSPGAEAARQTEAARAGAAVGLVSAGDPLAVGVRVMFRVVCDRFNTLCRRTGHGDLVVVEPEAFGLVAQALAAGLGDPGVRPDLEG